MSRDRAQSLFVLVVAILAFGAMAATLDSGRLSTGDRTTGTSNMSGGPQLNGSNGLDISKPLLTQTCPSPLTDLSVLTAFAGVVLVGGLALYRWRGSAVLPAIVSAPLLFGAITLCPYVLQNRIPNQLSGTMSTALLVGALVLALGSAFAFLYLVTDDRTSLNSNGEPSEESVDLTKVGKAAGDAADRIERQADVSNEVYRAWREMVRHLHVSNPEATTPDEFENRAIDAGMHARDVSELTRLFEEVRYGKQDPSEREVNAIAALRAIEDAYADEKTDRTRGSR